MKRCVVFAFVALFVVTGFAQPKIVAHRGYHPKGGAPRNSIEALKMAQKEKFDMVEFDVNMSSDGELLALHGDWHPSQKAANRVHCQHEHLVRELARLTPKETPISLTNNYYSPAFCHAIGCTIAGRPYNSWRKHTHFIKQARDLGMELMAWTVNNPEHIKWLNEQGFDYILTDGPAMTRNTLSNKE